MNPKIYDILFGGFSSYLFKKKAKMFNTSLLGFFVVVISGVPVALANIPEHASEMREMVVLDSEGEPQMAFGPINFDLGDQLLGATPIKENNQTPDPNDPQSEEALDSTLAHYPYHYPVYNFGNICRYGAFYCLTHPLPLGSTCSCWTVLGLLWFVGQVTTW